MSQGSPYSAFTRNALLRAAANPGDFLVVGAMLENADGVHTVTIGDDTIIATDSVGRRGLESGVLDLWRWAAGGAMVVIHAKDGASVGLVRYRDAGARTWGDRWTIGAGLSGSTPDLVNPLGLAVREAVEEFIVMTPAGVAIPTFGDPVLDRIAFEAVGSGRALRNHARSPARVHGTDYFEVPASFGNPDGQERLRIVVAGEEVWAGTGLIVLDSEHKSIDFLKVIHLQVPFLFADITVYDGEDAGGAPLNAPVGGLRFEDGRLYPEFRVVYQDGAAVMNTPDFNKKVTPSLMAIFQAHGELSVAA